MITPSSLNDAFVFEPRIFNDDRGYFFESFNEAAFTKESGYSFHFVQDNQVQSVRNVLRGLHFQKEPYAQTKLVRALEGVIWDVIVDIRRDSNTFGQWFGVELSAENKKQLLVPRGFAHGYSVLSETAEVFYKCDNYYNKESEGGILYNDMDLNIDWRIAIRDAIVSEKDLQQQPFKAL